MKIDFSSRKQLILGGVVLLVLADVVLGTYTWQSASAPQTPQQLFAQQSLRLKMLQADIDRAQKIRSEIPAIQKDCDQFERSLFPANSGYSSVTSELDGIARKAGVQLEGKTFKEAAIEKRNLIEVALDATVSGDYRNVIEFLNGLQRSSSMYEVDSLTLATDNVNKGPAGAVKVAVHLKTYFRTEA
jgi:Tfp pilus assembly protein PilO